MKTADTSHEPASEVATAIPVATPHPEQSAPSGGPATEPSFAPRPNPGSSGAKHPIQSPKLWAVVLTGLLLGTWLLSADPSGDARARVRTWIAASPVYTAHADYIDGLLERFHEPSFQANITTTEPDGGVKFDRLRYRYQLFFAMWSQAEVDGHDRVAAALRKVYQRQKDTEE